MGPERPEEFAPGLTPDLQEIMEQATRAASVERRARPGGGNGRVQLTEPRQLFLSELADIYYAEKALEKVLPQLAREATDKQLTGAFEQHLDETKKHAAKLEQVFEALGRPPTAEQCPGIDGIKAEHDKFMAEEDPSPQIRDLFLAGAAARAEHYEIAAYTGLITMARALRETKVTRLLEANLRQEKAALRKAETVAKRLTNAANGAGTRTRTSRPTKSRSSATSGRTARTRR
jgi:ferritin-like metal-binding protein YciE